MARTPTEKAFTLVELLVVLAIITLLIAILLPGLQAAREQGRRGVCLSNIRQIAQASQGYSVDDAREQIVPLHRTMVSMLSGWPSPSYEWAWRTAEPYSFGGRTATRPFPVDAGRTVEALMDNGGCWAAHTRPLNRYIYRDLHLADSKKLALFRCPSDTGYPDSEWVQDAPRAAAGIPCYDFLGNSYRINTVGGG